MPLTRLDNLISSKTGRYLYVSPDDFNASDELDNRGNSPNRPFVTIQRAFIEVARYSYAPGIDNDRFDEFTIMLMPGDHYIDNRPGLATDSGTPVFSFDQFTNAWTDSSVVDLSNSDNVLHKFNDSKGGCVVPRGCSLIGYDLRRTHIRPLYVPDPADKEQPRTSIFNVTGGAYIWQFTIKDGDITTKSPLYDANDGVGKVYYRKGDNTNLAIPEYSHHKITVFQYAEKPELDLYYTKVAKAFAQYQPTIDDQNEFGANVAENRIVGPLSDLRSIESIQVVDSSPVGTVTVNVTTKIAHGYIKDQFFAVQNNGLDDALNGTFSVASIDATNRRRFSFQLPGTVASLGLQNNQTYTTGNGLNTGAFVQAEVDSVESASPYMFNLSIRSTWGICGLLADGSKATGFKSMVCAQYTGVSLQKDDRAFIRYDKFTNTWNQASLSDAFATVPYHTKGDAYWKDDWRNCHIKATNDAFIQCVSIFAVGFADHFLMESGGDMSITNSNSNFGNTSLHAVGHKGYAFAQDKGGYIDAIIPPEKIVESAANTQRVDYYTWDIQASNTSSNNTKLYYSGTGITNPLDRPAVTLDGYRIGARSKDQIFVELDPYAQGSGKTTPSNAVFNGTIEPSGFKTFPTSLQILNPTTVVVDNKNQDAANRIEENKDLIAQETYGYITEKYPALLQKNIIISKCQRDVGLVLDAVISDLRLGGNINTIQAAESYFSAGELNYIDNERFETIEGFEYARDLAIAASRNWSYLQKNCSVTSGSSVVTVPSTVGLAIGMKVEEYSTVVNNTDVAVGSLVTSNIPSNTYIRNILNATTIELGSVVSNVGRSHLSDGITRNATGTNSSANILFKLEDENGSKKGIWSSEIATVDTNITQDTVYPACSTVASAISTLMDGIKTIINQGINPVGDRFADAHDLLLLNKNYIADVAVKDMLIEYPTHTVPGGNVNCFDDIVDIVEAIAYNVKFGSNNKVWDAANLYVTGAHLAGEEQQSIYAFRVAKLVAQKVIQNQVYTPRAGVTTSYSQYDDSSITTDPNPVGGTYCADVISAMDTLFQLVEYGIDTAGSQQQQLGTYTPSNATYDAATGDLVLTMTAHGLNSSNKIKIAQDALTFTCGMDSNQSNHTYPRVGDPAFKNTLLTIQDLTTDTVKVNVGASPLVGYNISDASYTASTGVLELTVGNHEIGTGDTVKLDDNALEFRCAMDNYGSVHSYPRPTDPKFNTSITVDTVGTTSHTITDASYAPSTGELVATIAGHGFHARSQHTATGATFDPFTGKLVITVNNHGFSNGDSIKIADNSLTFTCLKDNNATNHTYPRSTDPSSGKSLVISDVDTNTFTVNVGTSSDRSTHTFVASGTNGITRVGDRVWLDDSSITFTCAKDNNATNHAYPRATDEASKKWIEITAADTDTFTINIGVSPDTSAHAFVSAVASGLKKQTGTIALNVGTSPAVTFTPTAATYDAASGDLVLTIGTHSLVAEQKFTPVAGTTYDPSTGIMSIVSPSHGLVVGDKVKIANGAVSFTCLEDSNNTTHDYPRATDPVANKEIEIVAATADRFDVQVLATVPSTNITAHTFASGVIDSITKAGQSVRLAADSLTFTCAMDGNTAQKTYPRASDPVYNTAIPIKAVGASTITLHVGPSPIVSHTSGAGTSYNPTTGDLVLAIGDHTLDIGDGIKIADNSLTFECDEDSRATQHTYPRSGDPAFNTSVAITAVGTTAHTVTNAVYNPVTGIMTLTIVGHNFANGNRIKLADNSLTFTCTLDGGASAKTYPRAHDPASGAWLEISNVQTDTFDVQVLPALPSTNTSTHSFTSATPSGLTRQDGTVTVNVLSSAPSTNTTQHYYISSTANNITTGGAYAHTFVSASAGAVQTGGDYAHTFWSSKPFGLKTGGNYPHAFVTSATDGVTAFATNAGQFAATTKTSPSQNVVSRSNPSTSTDQFAQRATLFTIDAGGTNPHKFETGTPVRLVARAKAGQTPDERDVRLPQGFQPNRAYYVIAPGRNTQPFNYNDAAVYNGIFDGGDQTKLMLAESPEAAAAGIYIYSPETEALDADVEILVQHFTLDTTYDLHEYKVTFSGSSSTILKTDVAHVFDKPSSSFSSGELQKVFFRATGSDGQTGVLPTLAGSGAGQISKTQEFYVRYITEDTFKIFETATAAILGSPEVQLSNNPTQFWYVLANKRTSPVRFDPTFVDISASRTPAIPDGLWYLNLKDEVTDDANILGRLKLVDYSGSSGRTQTTDSFYNRTKDERKADDRIYRLRYVQPKTYPGSIRKPNNGFVLKLRTDDKRNLVPQNIILEPVGGAPAKAVFRNPQSQNGTEELGMTKTAFDAAVQAGSLQDKYIYDPDNNPCIVNTDSYLRFSIRSAREVTVASQTLLQVTAFDHRVDDTNAPSLKNTVFHTVEINAPQGGAFGTSKISSTPTNIVQWSGGSSGFGYIHAYFTVGTKHYIILKDVSARPTYDPLTNTRFQQGAVYADQQADVNGGRDSKDNNLYVVGGSNVFTLTVGDTMNDTTGNQYKIIAVEDVPQIEDTFYIFDSEEIQERVADQQDGIYYLTAVRGNISPLPRGAGVGSNFQNFKFSQPISSLYPLDYKNDPTWYQVTDNNGTKDVLITDAPAANSFADNYTHGLVWINDYKRSMTKEAITDLTETSFFKDNTYSIVAQTGNATAGSEQRKIAIAGDAPSVHDQKVYIELRRPSIARSGNHTFEYLGFGPGNYSTGLPARQEVILSEFQDYYSQAKREDGGIVFYTGLNSNGDLYIGNKKIDAITGEETFLEKAQLKASEDDTDTIGQLITSFDTPVTFKDKITVEGVSNLNNQVIISTQPPTETPSLIVRSNPRTDGGQEDVTLTRTSFADNNAGDITISRNKISAAILHVKGRGSNTNPGQEYSLRSNYNRLDALPSNRTPDQAGTFNANQVVSYYNSGAIDANPQAGDILYKGGSIENSGSLGWIYANYYTTIPESSILDVTTNGGTTVKINWSGVLDNTSSGIKMTVGKTIRITGFVDQTLINGKWVVSKADQSGANNDYIEFICANALPAATYTWNPTNQPNAILERSDENWKETGVIGSEVLRTDTDTIGQYKLGVNTVARTAHNAHEYGFLTYNAAGVTYDQQEPRANLDVVGNAYISGKAINDYTNNSTISKTETLLADAFVVGGDSTVISNAATLRVSTLESRVGINATNSEMDASLFVKGTLHLYGATANADIDGNLNIDGGEVTTNTTTLDLFNSNAATVNFVGDATTLTIGDNATSAQTIDIGTSSTDTTLNIHTSSIDSTVNIGVVADTSTNKSVITMGGAFSNTANSTFTIKNAQTILDGDLDVNGGDLQSNSATINLFTRAGYGSEVNFASRASILKFGGVAGTTEIRNSLRVNGDTDVYGDTTMHGGSNSGTVTVNRARLLTSKVAHAAGSLTNLNVDFYKFVEDIDGPETVTSVDNSDGKITLVQNYFIDGNLVKFTDVSGLTGVNTTTQYHIKNPSGNDVYISTSASFADKVNVTGTPGVAVALTLDYTKVDTSGAVGGSTTQWSGNPVDAGYEYLPVNNIEGIEIGDILVIGTELCEVVSPGADVNNRRVKVARGTDCTTVAAHNDNEVIRKLEKSSNATYLLGGVPQNATTPALSNLYDVTDLLEVPLNALSSGDAVKFSNVGSIVGVDITSTYFVVNAINDTSNNVTKFEISLDPGGAKVPISGSIGSAVLNYSDTLLSIAEFGGQFSTNDYLRLNASATCPSGEFVQITSVNNTNSEKFVVNDGANADRFIIDSVFGGVRSNVLGTQDFVVNLYGSADTNSTDNQFRIINGETLPATRLTVDSDGKLTIIGVGTEAAPKAIINKNGEEWLAGNLRINNDVQAGSVDSEKNSFYVNAATGNTSAGGSLSINDDFAIFNGATGIQFGAASTAKFLVDAATGDTRIGVDGSALGDGDLTVNGGHVNIVSTSTATPSTTDYALNITNLGVSANRNYRIRQDAAIDAFGVDKFYNKNGGKHWLYLTSSATLATGKNYMVNIAADTVFTLPSDAETGDMIRFVEVGGKLSYDNSLIIRAPLNIRIQGDNQGTNAGGLSSAYQGGELIVQTRNAGFGLVFAGSEDSGANTIPSTFQGWWIVEI